MNIAKSLKESCKPTLWQMFLLDTLYPGTKSIFWLEWMYFPGVGLPLLPTRLWLVTLREGLQSICLNDMEKHKIILDRGIFFHGKASMKMGTE